MNLYTIEEKNNLLTYIKISIPAFCFVLAMIFMHAQQTTLHGMEGQKGSFLMSLNAEQNAWRISHILMLVGIVLYFPVFGYLTDVIQNRNKVLGRVTALVAYIGLFGLIGQITLDFVLGVLAGYPDEFAANEIRVAIYQDPVIQVLFNAVANLGFLAGMAMLSITSIITQWLPRVSGILILLGWLVIILLNGKINYIEAVGHAIIMVGFLATVFKTDNL